MTLCGEARSKQKEDQIEEATSMLGAFDDEGKPGFLKFMGNSSQRDDLNTQIYDVLKQSGCHWACTYPASKRPRSISDGAIMYMARMVGAPNDMRIFGRAIASRHDPDRDNASDADIRRRPRWAQSPCYVRVHQPQFIAGSLHNGVSLNELFSVIGAGALASTMRNARAHSGNTDPALSIRRHPGAQLGGPGHARLRAAFEGAINTHGRMPDAALDRLDWPDWASRRTSSADA